MILADTSVWIDYLNGEQNRLTDALDDAIQEGVLAMGDLVLLEILQGIRRRKDYERTRDALLTLDIDAMLGAEMALKASENYRYLRRRGHTIRNTADVVIATFCIERGWALLFSDRDFEPFVKHLGLMKA